MTWASAMAIALAGGSAVIAMLAAVEAVGASSAYQRLQFWLICATNSVLTAAIAFTRWSA